MAQSVPARAPCVPEAASRRTLAERHPYPALAP